MLVVITCLTCAIAVLAVAALVAIVVSVCPPTAGAWRFVAGKHGTTLWRLYDIGGDEWRVLRGGHYIPRFEGPVPTDAALADLGAPISVREAVKTCRRLGLRCELMDLQGKVIAVVDEHGVVRVSDPIGDKERAFGAEGDS